MIYFRIWPTTLWYSGNSIGRTPLQNITPHPCSRKYNIPWNAIPASLSPSYNCNDGWLSISYSLRWISLPATACEGRWSTVIHFSPMLNIKWDWSTKYMSTFVFCSRRWTWYLQWFMSYYFKLWPSYYEARTLMFFYLFKCIGNLLAISTSCLPCTKLMLVVSFKRSTILASLSRINNDRAPMMQHSGWISPVTSSLSVLEGTPYCCVVLWFSISFFFHINIGHSSRGILSIFGSCF